MSAARPAPVSAFAHASAPVSALGALAPDLALAAAARAAADAIAPLRAETERAFGHASAPLVDSADMLQTLTQSFAALVAEYRDFGDAKLAALGADLTDISAAAAAMSRAMEHEREGLRRMDRRLTEARRPLADLARTVRVISMVSISARVAASHVASEAAAMSLFAHDIATLSANAEQVIADHVESQRGFDDRLAEARRARDAFETGFRDRLEALSSELQAALDPVTRRAGASVAASQRAERQARDLAATLMQVVAALQVGDNVQQRLDHAEAGLRRCAGPEGAAWPAALRRQAIGLQLAQLEAAQTLLDQEGARVDQGLDGLARQAEGAPENLRQALGLEEDAQETPLAGLTAALEQAMSMIVDCRAQRDALDRAVGELASEVAGLVGRIEAIRDIEQRMQVISLNATVRCSRMGEEGKALMVVAAQLTELTVETRTAASAVTEALEQAGGQSDQLAGAALRDRSEEIGRVGEEVSRALEALSRLDARLGEGLAGLQDSGPALAHALRDARARLAAREALQDRLQAVGDGLRAALAEAPSDPQAERDPAHGAEAAAIWASFRAPLTMIEERQVHDAFLGLEPDPSGPGRSDAPRASAKGADEDEADMFLF